MVAPAGLTGYPMSRVAQFSRSTWNAYCKALEQNPVTTKSLTAALGFAVGDAIAQQATRGRNRYDYARTMRMSGFGLLFAGPIQGHYWFRYLDKKIFPHSPKSAQAVASKIAVDQLVSAPLGTAVFFTSMKILEKRSDEIQSAIEEKLLPTVATGWKLWIPAHAINFGFIPPSQRVLYVNVIAIAWTYLLSRAASDTQPLPEDDEGYVEAHPS
ncbi:hypothetical protein CVIRNUC_010753 [Coccomyxa viridis]|uniref:Uncharacterized protein n=1 Tax=Coccomyxa viridis TaxID=1274662 RepID=A0AAV1IJM3_9CHLO|nr:hypothetical protein CVIRNUC_010753 [Coccomyxa viridis]